MSTPETGQICSLFVLSERSQPLRLQSAAVATRNATTDTNTKWWGKTRLALPPLTEDKKKRTAIADGTAVKERSDAGDLPLNSTHMRALQKEQGQK